MPRGAGTARGGALKRPARKASIFVQAVKRARSTTARGDWDEPAAAERRAGSSRGGKEALGPGEVRAHTPDATRDGRLERTREEDKVAEK